MAWHCIIIFLSISFKILVAIEINISKFIITYMKYYDVPLFIIIYMKEHENQYSYTLYGGGQQEAFVNFKKNKN